MTSAAMKKPETFWEAASRVITDRYRKFSQLCRKTGSRATADNIHDLRVASRRLAAALRVFEIQELTTVKEYSANIRRRIGRVRDLDVAVGNIRLLLLRLDEQDCKACRPFLGKLLSRRRRWLAELKPDLRRSIPRPRLIVLDETDMLFRDRVPTYLEPLMNEALLRSGRVSKPDNARTLHLLRICFKRLRYGLEIFGSLAGEQIDRWLKWCRQIQDRLGIVHDLDVLIGLIEEEWKAETARGRSANGLEKLLQETWVERHRKSAELVEWLPGAVSFLDEMPLAWPRSGPNPPSPIDAAL